MNKLIQLWNYFDIKDLYVLYNELEREQNAVTKHKKGMSESKNIISFWYHKLLLKESTSRQIGYTQITERKKMKIRKRLGLSFMDDISTKRW